MNDEGPYTMMERVLAIGAYICVPLLAAGLYFGIAAAIL